MVILMDFKSDWLLWVFGPCIGITVLLINLVWLQILLLVIGIVGLCYLNK